MSNDIAADWLLHGVAAAQAGEKEEARDLLEHALVELDVMAEVYGTNDTDAREKAWYWLSRISDDPKQKRDYLENVLASNPAHPDARRELAILEGRLKPEEIVNPDRLNPAVAPAAEPRPEAVRRFVCPQCGGKLSFNPAKQMLACEYCGYQVPQTEAGQQDATSVQLRAADKDFSTALYTARAHRWELPTERILSCQSCGAHFTLPPSRVTGECPFCGSAHIVNANEGGEQQASSLLQSPSVPGRGDRSAEDQEPSAAKLIEPAGVIPFQFDEQGAIRQLRQWVAAQPLGKSSVKQAAFARPRPVYFPFWVFNMGGEVHWHGMVPQYRQDANVLVWVPRSGSEMVVADNLLVAASHSLPAALMNALGAPVTSDGEQDASSVLHRRADDLRPSAGEPSEPTFDLSALAPYAEGYLADWPAEIYQISLADASLVARERAFANAKRRSALGLEVQHLSYDSLGISIDTYKLILLPIWVSELHFKDKRYPLVVNGQSGHVYGKLPPGGLHGLLAGLLD